MTALFCIRDKKRINSLFAKLNNYPLCTSFISRSKKEKCIMKMHKE